MIWAKQLMPVSLAAQFDPALLDRVGPRTARDWVVDTVGFLVAVVFGVLILIQGVHDTVHPLTAHRLVIDAVCGASAASRCGGGAAGRSVSRSLCVVLGVFSASATIAGLLALSSLAVHRSVRPVLLRRRAVDPPVLGYAIYSERTEHRRCCSWPSRWCSRPPRGGCSSVPDVSSCTHCANVRCAPRPTSVLHADNARMAERTRIAREMHDVLAHRISLIALHAGGLEVRPDLPPEKVRETAELLRSTARQALEELRGVIGVLREEAGHEVAPAAPQPTLSDIPRLVEETRRAGAKIDFEMQVDQPIPRPARWAATPTASCRKR